MTDKPPKPCERCKKLDAIKGERFCGPCRRSVIADAMAVGKILAPPPASRSDRVGRHEFDPRASPELDDMTSWDDDD